MLRILALAIVVTGLLPVGAVTVQAADEEARLREKLKEDFRNEFLSPKMPVGIRRQWMEYFLRVIDDDQAPLDEATVLAAVNTESKDRESSFLATAFLRAYLFRNRSAPDRLVAFYKKIDEGHRPVMIFFLNSYFSSFLTTAHYPLAEMFFESIVARMAERQRNEGIEMYVAQSRTAIEMMAKTKSPAGPQFVLRMVKTRIADPIWRANVVYAAAGRWGPAAKPIVRWYYERCCWMAFDAKVCIDYFRKHLDPEEVSNLVQLKRKELAAALSVLE